MFCLWDNMRFHKCFASGQYLSFFPFFYNIRVLPEPNFFKWKASEII